MATEKQETYLLSLLVRRGFKASGIDSLTKEAADLPNSPTMRERMGHIDEWLARLTVQETSELIDHLKG